MADEGKKPTGAKAFQVNEPVPGQYICWAIAFKLPVPAEGMSKEEAQAKSEAFSEKVLALVDADGEVDVCEVGGETVRCLEGSLRGARLIAHVKASTQARNN